MAKPEENYHYIVVESYRPKSTAGLHGSVHDSASCWEMFPQHLQVECAKVVTGLSCRHSL